MSFNPHTDEDRQEMLASIGVERIEDLFTPIPADVRFPDLDLPVRLTELEAAAHLRELSEMNFVPAATDSYLGAGSYRHYIPATVNNIISRGEFFTAYTPYQPEAAQGTLQVIYEFQSMVAELLGVEVANASIYDGATALSEAVLMSATIQKRRNRVVVANTVNPRYTDVIRTYLTGLDLVLEPVAASAPFVLAAQDVTPLLDDSVACVVVQYPNVYGSIEGLESIVSAAHAVGAHLIVATYPTALALLRPPGALGADIVTAEGQPLGVGQSFGGPYVGLLGGRKEFVRQMPGRLVAVATDSRGRRGYVLALQTREQHIRREKATSNICTNQGLMATAATVYMSLLGPQGLREVAQRSMDNAHYLASSLDGVEGFAVVNDAPFFNEFTLRCPIAAAEVNAALLSDGIIGGLDLGRISPDLVDHLLVATTELNDRAGIDRMVAAVGALSPSASNVLTAV